MKNDILLKAFKDEIQRVSNFEKKHSARFLVMEYGEYLLTNLRPFTKDDASAFYAIVGKVFKDQFDIEVSNQNLAAYFSELRKAKKSN